MTDETLKPFIERLKPRAIDVRVQRHELEPLIHFHNRLLTTFRILVKIAKVVEFVAGL